MTDPLRPGYNKVGNRTWVKYATGSGDVYKYDGTDQLIGVKYGVGNPQDGYDLATGESRAVTYTYDALGNRSVMVDNLTMTNYTVNNLNQYTQIDLNNSYTYDTNGNLTTDGTWTFGYDREGHLISANRSGTSVSYKYDAMGRRIEKNVNGTVTKYAYSGQDLIEERDGSNNVTAKYVYAGGIDKPVKVIKGTNTFYFQQDVLGNVSALTNASGAIVESYTYDAFGKPTIKDGSGNVISTPSTPFLFTGREFDAETGLYHYRARAYSPNQGRFLQMDSIGFGGGDLNLYRYVGNQPITHFDPNGTCCESEHTRYMNAADIVRDSEFALAADTAALIVAKIVENLANKTWKDLAKAYAFAQVTAVAICLVTAGAACSEAALGAAGALAAANVAGAAYLSVKAAKESLDAKVANDNKQLAAATTLLGIAHQDYLQCTIRNSKTAPGCPCK